MSLRKQHTNIKKGKEREKKARKLAKQVKKQGLHRPTKKEPGIPNNYPYKKELLEELKQAKELEATLEREKRSRARAVREQHAFDQATQEVPTTQTNHSDLAKTVATADLVAEVLDARNPGAFRIPALESMVGDKLIFLLHKTDLVPAHALEAWRQELAAERPTFLSSELLEEMQKNLQGMLPVGGRLAIVGRPNVGKSSVTNLLAQGRVATVTSHPGQTKKAEEFEVAPQFLVIDTPGCTWKSGTGDPVEALTAVNNIETLKDPYTPVQGILSLVEKKQLLLLYAVSDFEDLLEFLKNVAFKRGKVQKGGVADFEAAAKIVLHDWAVGSIPYFTTPA